MPTSSVLNSRLFDQVKSAALELGFDHCALTRLEIPSQDRAAYLTWCAEGGAAGMDYMTREPEKRTDAARTFPGMQSVLTLGVSYYQGARPEKPGAAYGRIARYAWGLDYHTIIAARLKILEARLLSLLGPEAMVTSAIDTKPLLERSLASAARLGFIGKNTVLIIPRSARYHVGSWVFLAEVLLNIPVDDLATEPTIESCGGCTRCLDACPTNAFVRPYRLESGKCIAYLTIENKGWIPRDMRPAIGDWLFGCDICQEVCPFNARAFETRWPEFRAEKGAGPWVSLRDVLETEGAAQFNNRWGETPLSRAKWKGLVRNACVVAGNSGAESLVPSLSALLESAEPLARGHALWALSKLVPLQARAAADKNLKTDPDAEVRQECEAILAA